MAKLLVVDDEQAICWGIQQLGERLGHEVRTASSAEEGLQLAAEEPPHALVLDIRLPGRDGLSAMAEYRRAIGEAPIIIMTAFGDLQSAVTAVTNGAFEYVVKPFDLATIRGAVERALRTPPPARLERSPAGAIEGMIGRSPAMQEAFRRIALAAHSDTSVLLRGETGVGKEVAAHAIHRHSARAAAPLVAVNIAALSPSLAEAELFGHVEGAFTGAQRARPGLLVQADGGVLFLDEVAETPLPLQVKLLRALDQGEVLPVGADRPVQARFRVISATHRDLQQMVQRGEFRHDLYYRLCAFEIELPPLRERREDIPLLAQHFAAEAREGAMLADETIAALQQREWSGNVRELRNAVEHSLVVARSGVVLPDHLPAPLNDLTPAAGAPDAGSLAAVLHQRAADLLGDPDAEGVIYDRYLDEVELPLLRAAMDQYGRQCAPAARALGLHRTTLKRKLDQHGEQAR